MSTRYSELCAHRSAATPWRPSQRRPRMVIQPGSAPLIKRARRNLLATLGTSPAIQASVAVAQHVPAEASLPTRSGDFRIRVFRTRGTEVVAISRGILRGPQPVLVRLHSECLTGDALGSLRCDCGEQLQQSLETIARAGRGVVLYLRQEGRGIGLANKIRAYALQDAGLDTVDANVALGLPVDGREYASAAAILRHLGIRRLRLLTNNPAKCRALEQHGIRVVERVPLEVAANPANLPYLRTKATRLGHLLTLAERDEQAEQ